MISAMASVASSRATILSNSCLEWKDLLPKEQLCYCSAPKGVWLTIVHGF